MPAPLESFRSLLPDHVVRIAERATRIPTLAGRAAAMKAERAELVRGDIGQIVGVLPDDEVLYGPPVGLDALRAAVAETLNLTYGLDAAGAPEGGLTPAHVVMCTGAAQALSLTLTCVAHGRVVGLPRGHWENYDNAVDLAGGRAVVIDMFDAAGRLDLAGIEARIGAEGVDVLLVNFPCNPTGAVLDDEEMAALGALVERLGVVVIADEVYARLRYDRKPPTSLLRHAPGCTLLVGSASKEYLLPGARVGYVACTQPEFTNTVLRRLLRASTASPNVLGQRRLLPLLERDLVDLRAGREPGYVSAVRDAMRARRDALVTVLERHGMPCAGRPPEGTIFLMAKLPAWWDGDDVAFAERAIDEAAVSSIPGSAFGLDGTVRLSFGAMTAADIERLDERLATLRACVTRP